MTKLKYAFFYFTFLLSLSICAPVNKNFQNTEATEENIKKIKNEYTGENYFSKEEVLDLKSANSEKDKERVTSGYIETNSFIFVDDWEKINSLKNKGVLQKLQKIYSEEGFESKELLQQMKKIISDALHIPLHEIHLHDLNMLMSKWRDINRAKYNVKQLGIDEPADEDIKKQGKKSETSESDLLVELPGGEVQKGAYVDVDYLIDLTK